MWCGREHRELKARLISYECAEEKESHLFFIHFNRDRWNDEKGRSHPWKIPQRVIIAAIASVDPDGFPLR